MTETTKVYDITIIGGGPTGMFAAFYAGMRNASVKIIETLPVLGGQVGLLYPDKTIYDIGGMAKVTGKELVDNLTRQMNHFEQTVCLEEEVLDFEKNEDGHFVLRTDKDVHYSKTILITAGNGSFQPRKLAVEGAEQYEETNLQYLVTELEEYRNKTVVICGGGDSAVDWALTLEGIAEKVYLVHRRNTFRAHEYPVTLLEQSSVEILTPFVPDELHGDGRQLEAVTFKEARGDRKKTIELDKFIVNYGFSSSLGPIKNWGLEMLKKDIKVNPKMETSIAGVYAAGDIASYDGKIKLIATGFGEAPTAVNHAIHSIDPKKRTQPMQSTQLSFED